MALQSKLFRGDAKLEAAATLDVAHIARGAKGDHVRKIQQALIDPDAEAESATWLQCRLSGTAEFMGSTFAPAALRRFSLRLSRLATGEASRSS